jgi:glyoxylate reductase
LGVSLLGWTGLTSYLVLSATASWNALSDLGELITASATNRSEFIEECQSGKLDGVTVICDRAPSSLATTGKYDEELIQALPKSLKFICHNGESSRQSL